MCELYHKTVFLLDHCLVMRESSGIQLEIESSGRTRLQQQMPGYCYVPPVVKPLWPTIVENTLEYARVTWDIFSEERPIRFIISNPQVHDSLNNWHPNQQNMSFICEAFSMTGPPAKSHGSIQIGIKAAVEALSEPSPSQLNSLSKVRNKGRIICITSSIVDQDLEEMFLDCLSEQNRSTSSKNIHIHELELVIISVHPIGKDHLARVLPKPLHDISPTVRSETIVLTADFLYRKLMDLCISHHNLVTTTVTGIPMKEEQNSTSSSNYDVNLFHPRLPNSTKESMVLKWSSPTTPKGPGLGSLHHCINACRITPVEVNSRPSTCLSNFVLNGRSVWLEMLKKNKTTSHVLTAHGSEIWMHIIYNARNILEDPPSISEGIGGRVTDYRIPDFVDFMKLNMLTPYPDSHVKPKREKSQSRRSSLEETKSIADWKRPIELAKNRLQSKTAYWPLTISGSLLFPMAVHLENLLKLLPNDKMTDMEKNDCDKTIWNLMAIEARGDPPPIPSPHHKKGHKRDEQWRNVYMELETFIEANQHSEQHRKILECFRECKRDASKDAIKKEEKLRGKDVVSETILYEISKQVANLSNPMTDSPMSPPPLKKPRDDPDSEEINTKTSLLSLWTAKTEKRDYRILPLGMKLYADLEQEKATKINK